MSAAATGSGTRVVAVRLACADPVRSRAFYLAAFGFRDAGRRGAGGPMRHDGKRDACRLRLGAQHVELVRAARPGLRSAVSTSTAFQHFALIVADMDAAMRRLRRVPGWRPISRAGLEVLPASSGGVTAFKFRDPDGHPLELLQFPAGEVPDAWRAAARRAVGTPCLGIDHTAIGVADTARSIDWYGRLGFTVMQRGVNEGVEQERMDDVEGVRVEVTGLRPPGGAPPHLELLCYRAPGAKRERVPDGDRRATRTVLSRGRAIAAAKDRDVRDPDGHRIATPRAR